MEIVVILIIAAIALVAGVIYSAHIHAKALAAVKEGTMLQQGIVTELHNSIVAGNLAFGTLQRFVDSHITLTEAKAKAIAKIL